MLIIDERHVIENVLYYQVKTDRIKKALVKKSCKTLDSVTLHRVT